MKRANTAVSALLLALVAGLGLRQPAPSAAAPTTAPVDWTGRTSGGQELRLPVRDAVSVVAFIRVGQPQSKQALEHLRTALARRAGVAPVLVVSGPQSQEQARDLAVINTANWPVVLDAGYELSGRLDVHVWPTAVVLRKDGTPAAYLAGLPPVFAGNLAAGLDFAAGSIDAAEYARRLDAHGVVADDAQRKARRHLEVALRLLAQRDTEQAKAEIDAGLKLQPEDPLLRLALARLQADAGRANEALQTLDSVRADAVPAWQIALVRTDICIKLGRWDDARKLLPETLKLNPHPGEAHYLAGLVHQHDAQHEKAAESFRKAYESR